MAKPFKDKNKRTNPLLWFIFAIVIPLIITIIVTIFILVATGVDVKGWVKDTGSKIPVISSLIKTDEDVAATRRTEKSEAKINEQAEEIANLNKEISDLKSTIEGLEQDVIKAKHAQKTEQNMTEQQDFQQDKADASLKAMAASFKKMNKKQAALIFADLDSETALTLLRALPNEVRGGILEAMEPKQAATLMKRFINE